MAGVLIALQSLFSLWMLIDATRRGVERYWYMIILMPFGPVVYFLTVKIHDPEFRSFHRVWRAWTTRKVTLEDLRYQANETPSFANKLALAQGLFDAGHFDDAAMGFQDLLTRDDECKDALYGFALCRMQLEDYAGAVEPLRCLIDIKPSFSDYDGWAQLALALRKSDQLDEAVRVLEELVRKAPRLSHRVLYARHLGYAQQRDKARAQLEVGLKAFDHAPRFQQRQEAAAAKAARTMLSEINQA